MKTFMNPDTVQLVVPSVVFSDKPVCTIYLRVDVFADSTASQHVTNHMAGLSSPLDLLATWRGCLLLPYLDWLQHGDAQMLMLAGMRVKTPQIEHAMLNFLPRLRSGQSTAKTKGLQKEEDLRLQQGRALLEQVLATPVDPALIQWASNHPMLGEFAEYFLDDQSM